jgi:hypothetical protein
MGGKTRAWGFNRRRERTEKEHEEFPTPHESM